MKELVLEYPRDLFPLWKTGDAPRVWHAQYPELFKKSDWRTVSQQFKDGSHFGEWFTALHYWHQGYRVLIEKYVFRNHPEDYRVAEKLLGKETFRSLCDHVECQPPDLLVYRPDMQTFFFVEVKVRRDRLSAKQAAYFEDLGTRLRCDVLLMRLKPVQEASGSLAGFG